jgi:hypothetical protein
VTSHILIRRQAMDDEVRAMNSVYASTVVLVSASTSTMSIRSLLLLEKETITHDAYDRSHWGSTV